MHIWNDGDRVVVTAANCSEGKRGTVLHMSQDAKRTCVRLDDPEESELIWFASSGLASWDDD